MDMRDYLNNLNQEELLTFYDELSNEDKESLMNDIKSIDIEMMNNLYNNSYINEDIDMSKISPLKYVLAKDIEDKYIELGKEFVKNNKYGVLIMAGGVGSRVGLNIPKGCIELNIKGSNISLFETYINQLKKVYDELNVYINLFIMTSFINHDDTVKYFEEHNYFDYPEDKIHFFMQDKLPIMNIEGKILLKDKSHILYGPNGNGNVFNALKKANLIDYMKSNNIEKVLFVTVDNIKSILVDYKTIGYSLDNKILTKTLYKEDKDGKDWIYCLYDNKPFILPIEYITDDIKNDESYKDINITYHIINTDEIEKYSNIDFKYHRTYKDNKYLDLDGKYKTNKTFKFEQYIFDAFNYSDDMILYRVEKDEFAPIKTQEDIDKINKQI